jgi:hypothetical protein
MRTNAMERKPRHIPGRVDPLAQGKPGIDAKPAICLAQRRGHEAGGRGHAEPGNHQIGRNRAAVIEAHSLDMGFAD